MDEWEDVKPARPAGTGGNTIEITASHIERGVRGDIFNDAPALAFKEYFKADWAMVGWGYAKTGHPGNVVKNWNVSGKEFVAWMKDYDFYRKPVKPIVIQVYLDREEDRTPQPLKRKPRFQPTFYDSERRRKAGVAK